MDQYDIVRAGYRPARDYSTWNKLIPAIPCSMPSEQFINWAFGGEEGNYFTWDINSFFDSIKMDRKDWTRTRFTTPIGKFVTTRADYGHKRIMPVAQHISQQTTNNFPTKKHAVFVDDGGTKLPKNAPPDYVIGLARTLFTNCRNIGIKLSPHKLCIDFEEMIYCGKLFDQMGRQHLKEYIMKCIELQRPANKAENKQVLSMIRYLTEHIYHLASQLYPLSILESNDEPWRWKVLHEAAWESVKDSISGMGITCHPNDDGRFCMQTDGCDGAWSTVLFQQQFDEFLGQYLYKLIGFWSKRFPPDMLEEPTGIKECYAGLNGGAHFKAYLWRSEFDWVTDHKNIIPLFKKLGTDETKNHRIYTQMRLQMSRLPMVIRWAPGDLIRLADYGSRIGFDGKIAKRIREDKKEAARLKQKIKKLESLDYHTYLRYYGHYDELKVQKRLPLVFKDPKFESNIECINFIKCINCMISIKNGNLNALEYGFDYINDEYNLIYLNKTLSFKFWKQYLFNTDIICTNPFEFATFIPSFIKLLPNDDS